MDGFSRNESAIASAPSGRKCSFSDPGLTPAPLGGDNPGVSFHPAEVRVMCCFSGKVEVSGTNIFARASKDGRQFLVYSMQFASADDVAMILPIPTPKDSAEDAVKFINLEKYESFFDDLLKGFPPPRGKGGPK